jgi:hypothetical protein
MSTSPLQNAGTGWRARPEAHWALWAGVAGALAAAALSVKAILASAGSTAAIGFLFVPFVAAIAAIPVGIWGAALGHVVLRLSGAVGEPWIVFWTALVAAAALPAAVGYEVWRGLTLERAVGEAHAMDATQLERAFEASPWRRDKFYLGALAQNKAASAALLERIASLDNAGLFEPMGSLWDVKGENRKGLAVMRLVARHPNASAATLARLEAHPRAERLLTELLANPNLPAAVLAKHTNDTLYLAEWGLALNPNTSPEVMERLSRSENLYTRMNLTYNKATPRELLLRLAQDPDPLLAHNARLALERR